MVKVAFFLAALTLYCSELRTVKSFSRQPHFLSSCYGRNGSETRRRNNACEGKTENRIIRGSNIVSKNLHASIISDDANANSEICFLSQKNAQSLDLIPLIDSVSRYCTTRRGKNAITNLIHPSLRGSRTGVLSESGYVSERKKNLFQYDPSLLNKSEEKSYSRVERRPIITIARSMQEAQEEYSRVKEAMNILDKSRETSTTQKDERKSIQIAEIPPIYGVSSNPWDTSDPITDDDEWLNLKSYEFLDLENIIQAEQIMKTLLACISWSLSDETISHAPYLSKICADINVSQVEALHKDLKDAIIIKRDFSISDLTGSKSYSFKLNEDKFPQLILLRKKEIDIMENMDKSMKEFLKKHTLSKNKATLKAFDLDGRLVVPAPRKIADSLGIVRGFSKNGDMSYVEPNSMLKEANDLARVREDLSALESEIQQKLSSTIFQSARLIDTGLDSIARLDTIFARSVFGLTMNGIVPSVKDEGIIDIHSFVHPLLAINEKATGTKDKSKNVVPIDLKLGQINDSSHEALVISGPNGGGKTLAMKSFGLTATMCKLGIPITLNVDQYQKNNQNARVDFFPYIFTEVGDTQSILDGESTLIARLNGYSTIIQKLANKNASNIEQVHEGRFPKDSLILLDELGGGTDPVAGAALAQAILEKMLETKRCRIAVTTHSLQLKSLPLKDSRFHSAAVLLSNENSRDSKYKLPSFQLSYGSIGDSYGLGAASRCVPNLPDDVMQRASDLIVGQEGKGEMIRDINNALEKEREVASIATLDALNMKSDACLARDGTIALARAYKTHFSRLENRLDSIFSKLQEENSSEEYTLIGETLSEVRLMKKKVKTHEELLAEKGLKGIPALYSFREDETVVIVKKGEWEGSTATVIAVDSNDVGNVNEKIPWNQVTVVPSFDWNHMEHDNEQVVTSLTFRRDEIALWDYGDYESEMNYEPQLNQVRSIIESNQRLNDILSTIETKTKPINKGVHNKGVTKRKTFSSAQERKIARAEAKKSEKNDKKKSKKRRKK